MKKSDNFADKHRNHQYSRELLRQVVPDFNPQCGISDLIYKGDL